MTIRLEYQTLHNVRPRKGERSHQGRLIQSHVYLGCASADEARQELRALRDMGTEIHSAAIYDNDAFLAALKAWDTKTRFEPSAIERYSADTINTL